MDKLFSAGMEYMQGQNGSGNQPVPGDNAHGGNYPAGGGFSPNVDDDELRKAQQEAASRAGSSGNSDLFSSVINAISQKQGSLANEDIDEQDAINKHKKSYIDGDEHEEDSKSLGTAAAMNALKLFTQGETGNQQGKGAFLGLALSEASKLFDNKSSQGKVAAGTDKGSVLQQAGEMAVKMYLKSQGGQQGGLLGLASKFM